MAKNKNLGMGLDLLLTAGEPREVLSREYANISKVREVFGQALKQDEDGNFLEAYYLYRKLIDGLPDSSLAEPEDAAELFSQAFNNAAIILYEHGNVEKASLYLERSLAVQPDNQVAASNLEQLKKSMMCNKGG